MFLTIEGIDGSGKTTFAERAVALLQKSGPRTLWTREPGGWNGGELVRTLLLEGNLKNSVTEIMLFMADRCEHVAQVIAPALKNGVTVVCERYNDSTIAYQCWGRGIERAGLEKLIEWCDFPVPDLTIWLDVPLCIAHERISARGQSDRIESEKSIFHQRVAAGFESLSRESPGRIVRFDATRTPDELEKRFESLLRCRGLL